MPDRRDDPRRAYLRIIPILLLNRKGLVKTRQFKNPAYVGDPLNVMRIFNEKEVDEMILLDIDAHNRGTGPDFNTIAAIAQECFMPLAYGGGVTCLKQMERLFRLGVEKISLNTALFSDPSLIERAAKCFGSQAVIASIDVDASWFGRTFCRTPEGRRFNDVDPASLARRYEDLGAGEILLSSVQREGTRRGYDTDLISQVSRAVDIPVIANGGAGEPSHLANGLRAGASAAGAGEMFVFRPPHRAVLITYPERTEIIRLFSE